ncbi:hypothetical protein CN1A_5 [Clavibacter phage CN1A]|uniref:Uncharacterized protein n=1 Tax=Clavibacter phage CN1A TaxID=1406793 RepID=U5PTB5_9CAUD|nr:hypothetical protein CN1A_5 [Clavibacter phage CN1A]AGY47114.1 hypothetical protein CN1A_5 [Clavibacter phage CN1A]
MKHTELLRNALDATVKTLDRSEVAARQHLVIDPVRKLYTDMDIENIVTARNEINQAIKLMEENSRHAYGLVKAAEERLYATSFCSVSHRVLMKAKKLLDEG